jgi:hypothetical protein
MKKALLHLTGLSQVCKINCNAEMIKPAGDGCKSDLQVKMHLCR